MKINRRMFMIFGINLAAGAVIASKKRYTYPLLALDANPSRFAEVLQGFQAPPATAKPLTLWHWMNGVISKEGITADLESFKAVGLGGVQLFLVGGIEALIDDPSIQVMNQKWREHLKFAIDECERLGLEFGIHNSPGWSSTGFPGVLPEESMQKIVFSEIEVAGPQLIKMEIPCPNTETDYYKDILLIASKKGETAHLEEIINLTSMLSGNTLNWEVPDGKWLITRLGHTTTNKKNLTAPESGQGLEVDKLNPKGLHTFWKAFPDKIIKDSEKNAGTIFRRFEVDSYEMGAQNWTSDMREKFLRRCGYDALPLLMTLSGKMVNSKEYTERFKYDLKETIRELFEVNYYGEMQKLTNKVSGMQLILEPYATGHDQPFETNNASQYGDLLMCEFWQKPTTWGWDSVKPTVSGARSWGKTLVAAEAFTGQPNSAWRVAPGTMKSTGDRAFALGVNKIFLHTSAHQPWKNMLPGMTMGQWGTHFGRTQTWWANGGREWISYLTRCQYLLQQGLPYSDLCYLVYERITPKTIDGYDCDTIGTNALLSRLSVKNKMLHLPNGISYQMLILPNTDKMRPEILEKIRELVREGATIIGPKPERSPSLKNYPTCDGVISEQADAVWGKGKMTEHTYGLGRVFTQGIREVISRIGLRPDVEVLSHTGIASLIWVHRKVGKNFDIYFLSNQDDVKVSSKISFRISGVSPELWNPIDGSVEQVSFWEETNNRVEITIDLPASGALFVVFKDKMEQRDPFKKIMGGRENAFMNAVKFIEKKPFFFTSQTGDYQIIRQSGHTQRIRATAVPEPLKLTTPWDLAFRHLDEHTEKIRLDELTSWTELGSDLRYFSGTATYRKVFVLDENEKNTDVRSFIDLGTVLNTARIKINGTVLDTLWTPPFQFDITDFTKIGENILEIDITNLWANRLIGDEQYPDDLEWKKNALAKLPEWVKTGKSRPLTARKTFTTYKFFDKDDPLSPSGLLGPVVINFVQKFLLENIE